MQSWPPASIRTTREACRVWGDCDSTCSRTRWVVETLAVVASVEDADCNRVICDNIDSSTPVEATGQSRWAVAGWLEIVCRSMRMRLIGLPSRIYVATCRTHVSCALYMIHFRSVSRSYFLQFSTWGLSSQSLTKHGLKSRVRSFMCLRSSLLERCRHKRMKTSSLCCPRSSA